MLPLPFRCSTILKALVRSAVLVRNLPLCSGVYYPLIHHQVATEAHWNVAKEL